MRYDIAIIGAGPAGLAAALYAARRKLLTVIVSKDLGGQAAYSGEVENYLGFPSLSGLELIQKFQAHLKKYPVKIEIGQAVDKIARKADRFDIYLTNGNSIMAKSVIIAAGRNPRRLQIPGEKELEKKGVAYCATCDAPLFTGKKVAVIGGGNAALDSILQLEKYCPRVYSVNINPDFAGEMTRIERVKNSPKVEIFSQSETTKIIGKNLVEAIEIKHKKTGEVQTIAVSGVFIEIGSIPASGFLTGLLKLNEKGEIAIDGKNNTSQEGIFACGDVTIAPYKQIIIAAGEGAKAALACIEYLNTQKVKKN